MDLPTALRHTGTHATNKAAALAGVRCLVRYNVSLSRRRHPADNRRPRIQYHDASHL